MVAARAVSIIDLLVLHSRRPTGSPPPHVLCRAQTNSRPTAGKTFGSELKPGLLDSSLVCLPRLKRSTRNRIRLASACLMRRSQRLAAVKVLPDPVAIWISARERSSRSSISNLVRLLAEAAARRHLLADDAATEGGRGICLVELRGFEPLTSCMPCSFGLPTHPRSGNCAQPNGLFEVTVVVR